MLSERTRQARLARARRRETGKAAPDPTRHINSVNDTARQCATHYAGFLFLAGGLFILISGTTHEDLLRETPVQMPLFDIGVPLKTFYVLAPLIFLILHVNLLNKLAQLRAQATLLGTDEVRPGLRIHLFQFDYALLFGGFAENHRERIVLWIIVGATVFVMPVALLIYAQYRFLPYHSDAMTWWHRVIVTADIAALLFFHVSPSPFRMARRIFYASVLPLIVSWWFLTPPDRFLDSLGSKHVWEWMSYEERRLFGFERNLNLMGGVFFDERAAPEIVAAYQSKYGFDEKNRYIAERTHGSPLNLKGRDLRYANFNFAYLSDANLTRADLHAASMNRARLRGAKLSEANLRHAYLADAALDGALLAGANLSQATLVRSSLLGADLSCTSYWPHVCATLRGADLQASNLVLANLDSAKLEGANLRGADMTFASLYFANLRGANLTSTTLYGAEFYKSVLDASSFQNADIFGAQFTDVSLESVNFSGAIDNYADSMEQRLYTKTLFPCPPGGYSDTISTDDACITETPEYVKLAILSEYERKRILTRLEYEKSQLASQSTTMKFEALSSDESAMPGPGKAFEDWPIHSKESFLVSRSAYISRLSCEDGSVAAGVLRNVIIDAFNAEQFLNTELFLKNSEFDERKPRRYSSVLTGMSYGRYYPSFSPTHEVTAHVIEGQDKKQIEEILAFECDGGNTVRMTLEPNSLAWLESCLDDSCSVYIY